jgi:hypothetical protein
VICQSCCVKMTCVSTQLRIRRGKAVQVVPIKPTLKTPGIVLMKLRYDGPLSILAFKFNLRLYTTDTSASHGRALQVDPSLTHDVYGYRVIIVRI